MPRYLSDRLYAFRNDIAVDVIGRRPEFLFVSADGTPRAIATLRVAIQRAVLRHVGIKITPHQFASGRANSIWTLIRPATKSVRQLLAA